MSKERKKLMLEQFQGKPEEWIEKLLAPLNDVIDNTNRIDSKGLSFEKSLGVEYTELVVDVPSDWLEIGTPGAPAFESGWVNSGRPNDVAAIRKDPFGVVHMKGLVKSGTVSALAGIFTLPEAYRPPSDYGLHFTVTSNAAFGQIRIFGDVTTPENLGRVNCNQGSSTFVSLRASWEAADRTPIIPACFPILLKTAAKKVGLVMISQVFDSANNPVYTGPLYVDWVQLGDGRVSIRNIPGLKPATSYKITFAVFPR